MKMVTIASPWRYDFVAGLTTRRANPVMLPHLLRQHMALPLAPNLGT
jgi:hypothetical protein